MALYPAHNENQSIATIFGETSERARLEHLWGALMTNWTIRIRGACFWVVEFSAAAAVIVAFVTVVKYGL